MRVVAADPDVTTGDPAETHYRVRLWEPPSGGNETWFLDEWDLHDAADVLEVVDWAKTSSASGTFEVLVPQGGDLGTTEMRDGTGSFLRLYGSPGDTSSATTRVLFHREEED